MIALEVTLNGEKLKVAGSEDLGVLNAIIGASGKLGSKTAHALKNELGYDLHLHVGGLTTRINGQDDEHFGWVNNFNLKIGDEITVKIIEAASCDTPTSFKKVDKEKQKEIQERVKEKYGKKDK